MAGDWIKVRMDLHDDPAVITIGCRLNITEDEVVGKLVRFWAWASRHTTDGNADSVTEKWLDRYLGVTGMAQAMAQEGWLYLKEGGGITVPKFDRHNGDPAKKRAMTRLRVQRHRSKPGEPCNAPSVTEALPEKRREEKNKEDKSPPPPKGARTRNDASKLPEIPPELNTPEFAEAWADWVQHRSERKPKMTPTAAKQAFAKLAAWGPVRSVAAIKHSIAGSYQGIFENTSGQKPGQSQGAAQPATDLQAIAAKQREREREAALHAERAERDRLARGGNIFAKPRPEPEPPHSPPADEEEPSACPF